jgi:hypothetical protein
MLTTCPCRTMPSAVRIAFSCWRVPRLTDWKSSAKPLPSAADALRLPSSEFGVAAYLNDFYRAPCPLSDRISTLLLCSLYAARYVVGTCCLRSAAWSAWIARKLRATWPEEHASCFTGCALVLVKYPAALLLSAGKLTPLRHASFDSNAFEGERSRARRLGDERRVPCCEKSRTPAAPQAGAHGRL